MARNNSIKVVKEMIGSEVFYKAFVSDVCKDSEKSLIERFANTENIFFDYDRIQVCRMLATIIAKLNGIVKAIMSEYIDVVSEMINDSFSDEVLKVWASEYRKIVNSYF